MSKNGVDKCLCTLKWGSNRRGFIMCTQGEQIAEGIKIRACSMLEGDKKFVHNFSLKT